MLHVTVTSNVKASVPSRMYSSSPEDGQDRSKHVGRSIYTVLLYFALYLVNMLVLRL